MKSISTICFVLFFSMISFAQEDMITSDSSSFRYVYMEFSDGYSQAQQNMGVLYQVMQNQNLQGNIVGSSFVLYFDSFLLDAAADTLWGLGFQTNEDVTVKPPLKKAKFEYEKVIRMDFTGQYQMPSTGYNFIVPYIYENKLKVIGPPIDRWLDNPNELAPDSCRTEIIIPVEM